MSYKSTQIKPNLTKEMLTLSDAVLGIVATAVGQPIGRGIAPLIGNYIRLGDSLATDRIPSSDILEISYLWGEGDLDRNMLIRIGVGTKVHGPLLVWLPDLGWSNLYGNGDHGDNATAGGAWRCGKPTATMMNALKGRDYMVAGTYQERSALIEGPALIKALNALALQE